MLKIKVKKVFVIVVSLLATMSVMSNAYEVFDDNGMYGVKDDNGNVLVEPNYCELEIAGDFFIAKKDLFITGVFNKTGELVVPFNYKTIYNIPYYEYRDLKQVDTTYFFWVVGTNDKIGLLRHDGSVVLDTKYNLVDYFGLYKGKVFHTAIVNNNMGILGEGGVWLVEPKYDELMPPVSYFDLRENIAYVKKGKKIGIVGLDGSVIAPIEYDDANKGHIFNYVVLRKGKKCYLYNISDNNPGLFEQVDDAQAYGAYFSMNVKKNGKWAIVTSDSGVLKYCFDSVSPEGYLIKDGKQYHSQGIFKDGITMMWEVTKDDLGDASYNACYFMNTDFEPIIDESFVNAYDFKDGEALVKRNDDDCFEIINLKGETIRQTDFVEIYMNEDLGLNQVTNKEGLKGFVDNAFNYVIPCRYKDCSEFDAALFPGAKETIACGVKPDNTYEFFNAKGEFVNYSVPDDIGIKVGDYYDGYYIFIDDKGKSFNDYLYFNEATKFSMSDFPGTVKPIAAIRCFADIQFVDVKGMIYNYTPPEDIKYKFVYGNTEEVDETE